MQKRSAERNAPVSLALTRLEREQLRQLAIESDMSISAFLRKVLRDKWEEHEKK